MNITENSKEDLIREINDLHMQNEVLKSINNNLISNNYLEKILECAADG